MASDPYDPDHFDHEESDGAGCVNCQGGWKHGCMDDLCRGAYSADQCEDAIPCRTCNQQEDKANV